MCLSTSSFEPFIPSFQPRQQHSLPGAAVRPKLEGSVCHRREVGSLSYTSRGSNTALVTEHILGYVSWKEVPHMDVTSLTNLHLLYSILILQNFLPLQGGGSSRRHLFKEEIISPQTLGLLQVLFLHRTIPEAYDLLAVVPSI